MVNMSVYKQMYRLECSALALDFDGTIADTVAAHTQARRDALTEMSRLTGDQRFVDISPELQAEAHRYGSRPETIIGWLLKQSGIVESPADSVVMDIVAIKNELYREHAKRGLEPIEGAVPFVVWASDRFAGRLALVTTASYPREVQPFLEAQGLLNCFHVVVAREDMPASQLKPHPMAYQIALKHLDRPAKDTVAVEDSPNGIQAANSAGLTTVGITTTFTAAQLASSRHTVRVPDRIVKNYDELRGLL
jgi:HAD superfamily hydrolase (TIGR01509 family)